MKIHHVFKNTARYVSSLLLALVITLSPAAATASELNVAVDGSLAESTSEQQAATENTSEIATPNPEETDEPALTGEETAIAESNAVAPQEESGQSIESIITTEPAKADAGESDSTSDSTKETVKPIESLDGDEDSSSSDTDLTVDQDTNISSLSGSVAVSDTKKVGDVSTSQATASSNTLNIIQSDTNISEEGNLVTFTKDIQGDVTGDILIDPGAIPSDGKDERTRLDVNTTTSQTLNNDVTVRAATGDISVESARKVGDTSTGNAEAVANIVNLINSAVTSGKSFFGVINILGNLDGDILLPSEYIAGLLANNSTTKAAEEQNSLTMSIGDTPGLEQQFSNNIAINNNVGLTAASGRASADNVRRIGDVTTGDASTNLTIYNLANTQVNGGNTLLVFVNVLGTWTGFIVDAPTGQTSAVLGGGDASIAAKESPVSGSINAATSTTVNNNVNVSANSGNVSLANIRNTGNISTGDASASANIINIVNSQLSLANWFGILFINVFGTWNGSFGVNTEAGDPPDPSGTNGNNQPDEPKVLVAFKAAATTPTTTSSNYPTVRYASSFYPVTSESEKEGSMVAASDDSSATLPMSSVATPSTNGTDVAEGSSFNLGWAVIILGSGAVIFGGYRFALVRRATA